MVSRASVKGGNGNEIGIGNGFELEMVVKLSVHHLCRGGGGVEGIGLFQF